MRKCWLKGDNALSPIFASIILCSIVLVVGIASWNFVYGVSDYLQTKYFRETQVKIDEISERFVVEHVSYNAAQDILRVWVYNYGNVNITVNIYVYKGGSCLGQNETNTAVPSKGFLNINVSASALEGSIITVEAVSGRQNFVYESLNV